MKMEESQLIIAAVERLKQLRPSLRCAPVPIAARFSPASATDAGHVMRWTMLMLNLLAAVAFVVLIGCSVPELEQREPKITMAPWPKETNAVLPSSATKPRTVREAWEARGGRLSTPFQAYDDKITGAINKRWMALIEPLPRQPGGRVVLDFKMIYDGRVEDLKVIETNVPDNYVDACRKAILAGVPYEPWPVDMRKLIGSTSRDVTLRFYYH